MEEPLKLTLKDKSEYENKLTGIWLASDGFIPFNDNIDVLKKMIQTVLLIRIKYPD